MASKRKKTALRKHAKHFSRGVVVATLPVLILIELGHAAAAGWAFPTVLTAVHLGGWLVEEVT